MGTLTRFMTRTFDLWRPDGSGGKVLVAFGQACTPADPLSSTAAQVYPDQAAEGRQVFTKCPDVLKGDYLDLDGVEYAVMGTMPFAAQGGVDAFTQIIIGFSHA